VKIAYGQERYALSFFVDLLATLLFCLSSAQQACFPSNNFQFQIYCARLCRYVIADKIVREFVSFSISQPFAVK